MFRQLTICRGTFKNISLPKTQIQISTRALSIARFEKKKEYKDGSKHDFHDKNNSNSCNNKSSTFRYTALLAAAAGISYNDSDQIDYRYGSSPQQQQQQQQPHQKLYDGQAPVSYADGPRNYNMSTGQTYADQIYTNWNEFCGNMLAKGEVRQIVIKPNVNVVQIHLHDGAIIRGTRRPNNIYLLRVSSTEVFEKKLRDYERMLGIKPGDEVPITYEQPSGLATLFFSGIVLFALWSIAKFFKINTPSSITSPFTKAKFTLVDPTTRAADAASVRFKDVAGLQEAKVEVMEFVDYLKNSDRFLKLGAKLPKGVLLTGPPGCGKTLLAKAVATEANVPFLALAGSDFIEMIGGVGASRVRSLFKSANKLAPCIIYIDEIDSIGKKRSGNEFSSNGEMEQTLNQLLVEMDGLVSRKSVILLASTNRADVLDKALTRPGRFDRQILIDLPNLQERREIFEKHAGKIKLASSVTQLSNRIAQLTPGMSGADLANVCNEAALHAARKNKLFVESEDLEYAIERLVGGTERRSSSISAHERRIIAFHESGHALVGWLLKYTDPILKVSIVPRTSKILGYAQYIPSDRKLHSPDEFFDKMCMALGGRVAELIKFNHLSSGAQDDLKRVTEMAMAQIKEYGFDPVIGNISFPKQEKDDMGIRPYSKHLANIIDHRASIMVKSAFERTHELLKANVDKLNTLAEALIEKEVMNTSDIEKLIGPRKYAQKKSDQ